MSAFENARPDPDDLLNAVKDAEERRWRGRLKIYLGMSAGVGKTFAMLKGAHELAKQGRKPLVGLVETHGRSETLALLPGLEVLPRLKSVHKGVALEDFDLDAALARKPDILLLDELAHANVPGCRHARRWQDVIELLDAGIEVHTTLNVQHLESRADSVETMTGVRVTETVPDSLLDRAQEIVVIDLDPHALLARLREGKIYPAERARAAEENFFKAENLTALREIALRVTADRVDRDLQTIHKIHHPERPWRATERLLVAVYASPYSELMIRRTRLLADTLNAAWFGAYVETGRDLAEEEKKLLADNLALVRELGGEVITTLDPHPARGLLRLCRDHNVTQIVMGKSRRSWWKKLFDKTPTDELLKESYPVDIYIVSGERGGAPSVKERLPVPRSPQGRLPELGWMLVLVAATAFLADPLVPILGYRSIGLVFLLPVLALSLFARPKVIWAGTVLSTLVWDYFFIPPFHTLSLQHEQDYVMLALFLAVATVTGTLTSKLRRQRGVLETRERRASLLYRLSKALAAAASAQDVLDTARRELGELLGESVLLLPRAGEGLSPSPRLDPKERAVAEWVLKNDKPAGRFTDTLPAAEGSYFPLFTRQASEGVMGLLPARRRLTPELRILLEAVCGQLGLALQKERLGEQARAAELARESDRLSRSLLNVVSHELKTPLTALLSAASSLEARAAEGSEREGELLRSVGENGRRLARIVDHLLEANRMEAGKIEVRRDPVDLRDVLDATLRRLGPEMAGRPVNIRAPEGTLLVETDEVLLGTVLRNLVHNALFHTPPGTPVHLQVRVQDGRVLINVRDEGPGLPPGNEEKIFEKFYRGPQATPGGSGLGLALARGLAEALGGTLTATSTEPRGADFALSLPFRRPA